jgi:hypothetical protein
MPLLPRRALLAGLTSLPMLARAQASAVIVEGKRFERSIQLHGRDLLLNGTGIRAVAWFKGYAAGLYLLQRASTPAAVIDQPGPKRLRMQLLQEVPAAEFSKAVDKGINRNTAAADRPRLAARLEQFERGIDAIGKVKKNDIVDLDLDPARGTVMSINGTMRGEPIAGADFYAALLRSFVGDDPYDEALKAGLLGRRK